MKMARLGFILLFFSCINCNSLSNENESDIKFDSIPKGALLTTSFDSFGAFEKEVAIEFPTKEKPWVQLTHSSNGGQVVSILKSGVSEADFIRAKQGGLLSKLKLAFKSPYFVANRMDLLRVYFLARRKHQEFGWPDKAFYDIAESMKNNINQDDLNLVSDDDLSDKGYINTFNHIVAQSFMTTLFSEKLADFVADSHERKNMPELVTGKFTLDQLEDVKNGVVDNYVDIINNEWGQELGKHLKQRYKIDRDTIWTSALLADYLNDIQSYFARVFKLRFKPFTPEAELCTMYSQKINRLMNDVSGL